MIEGLLYFVIYLLVIGVVFWLLNYIIETVPLFEPFRQVARIVLVVLGCVILIYLLLGLIGGGSGAVRFPRLS